MSFYIYIYNVKYYSSHNKKNEILTYIYNEMLLNYNKGQNNDSIYIVEVFTQP